MAVVGSAQVDHRTFPKQSALAKEKNQAAKTILLAAQTTLRTTATIRATPNSPTSMTPQTMMCVQATMILSSMTI
jgi:hypothetical protein